MPLSSGLDSLKFIVCKVWGKIVFSFSNGGVFRSVDDSWIHVPKVCEVIVPSHVVSLFFHYFFLDKFTFLQFDCDLLEQFEIIAGSVDG